MHIQKHLINSKRGYCDKLTGISSKHVKDTHMRLYLTCLKIH
jgi:hypothetical protein